MAAKGRKPAAGSRRRSKVREAGAVHIASASLLESETPIKKNVRLHQSLIDKARRILRTPTETATIEAALDLVAFRHELVSGVDAMRGKKLVKLFE